MESQYTWVACELQPWVQERSETIFWGRAEIVYIEIHGDHSSQISEKKIIQKLDILKVCFEIFALKRQVSIFFLVHILYKITISVTKHETTSILYYFKPCDAPM